MSRYNAHEDPVSDAAESLGVLLAIVVSAACVGGGIVWAVMRWLA